MGLQRLINILGQAINESCKKLECKKADHNHDELLKKFKLLPPRWEDQGRESK
jgi:hypothetical protein